MSAIFFIKRQKSNMSRRTNDQITRKKKFRNRFYG